MKVSTKEELERAEKICQIKNTKRFIRFAEAMMQKLAKRQEKLLQIQEIEENLTIETN